MDRGKLLCFVTKYELFPTVFRRRAENDDPLPLLRLQVTDKGVGVASSSSSAAGRDFASGPFPIETVSYGVQDIVYQRVFAMIVVKGADEDDDDDGTTTTTQLASEFRNPFECYAFVCDSSANARRLTYALARAFQVRNVEMHLQCKCSNQRNGVAGFLQDRERETTEKAALRHRPAHTGADRGGHEERSRFRSIKRVIYVYKYWYTKHKRKRLKQDHDRLHKRPILVQDFLRYVLERERERRERGGERERERESRILPRSLRPSTA